MAQEAQQIAVSISQPEHDITITTTNADKDADVGMHPPMSGQHAYLDLYVCFSTRCVGRQRAS